MKIGFVLSDLGASQLNFLLIKNINAIVSSRPDIDIVAFYETLARPCLPLNFAAMQVADGWGFDGALIATTLSTADKISRFPATLTKLFYSWDLEWLRLRHKEFRELRSVYGNPELKLVARCTDHAAVLQQAWNRDVTVVEDADVMKLIQACQT